MLKRDCQNIRHYIRVLHDDRKMLVVQNALWQYYVVSQQLIANRYVRGAYDCYFYNSMSAVKMARVFPNFEYEA